MTTLPVNGTLRISGVEAVEDLRTVNGNIEVYEGGGSVHAHTTNGSVHLELLHVQDKSGAIAETTNGSRSTARSSASSSRMRSS